MYFKPQSQRFVPLLCEGWPGLLHTYCIIHLTIAREARNEILSLKHYQEYPEMKASVMLLSLSRALYRL